MDIYCKTFVEDTFKRHDRDNSGILERRELKEWIRKEVQTHKYFKRQDVKNSHTSFFNMADQNGDGKVDRWELFDYCLKKMKI